MLIRHGVTSWHRESRVLGRRDIELSDEGIEQAERATELLAPIELADLISSPLQRSVATAERIGKPHGLEIARDPRLTDVDLGEWAGRTYDEITASPEYQRFLAEPADATIPRGEQLDDVRIRTVAALEQSLADSPSGSAIALVTHSSVIRILLAHFLGSPPGNYHRISVSPGSVSVLSFADDRELPRVLATNCLAGLLEIVGE